MLLGISQDGHHHDRGGTRKDPLRRPEDNHEYVAADDGIHDGRVGSFRPVYRPPAANLLLACQYSFNAGCYCTRFWLAILVLHLFLPHKCTCPYCNAQQFQIGLLHELVEVPRTALFFKMPSVLPRDSREELHQRRQRQEILADSSTRHII